MASKSVGEILYTVKLGDPSASVDAFYRKSAKDINLKESWFRDAIAANPELIIAPCREAAIVSSDERWFCWKTEYGIDAGSIDVLLLSSYGRIGIIETKLSYNPQARREVVVQLLDYALALRDNENPFEALPPVPVLDGSPIAETEDIKESLANGDFLLIIAGDALDPRAIRIGSALLAQHFTSMWTLAMVDMNIFYRASNEEYLLVPELRGMVEQETRQTMQVTVKGESPKARIEVERFTKAMPSPASRQRTIPWTIEEACDGLKDYRKASALRIFNLLNAHPLVRIEGGLGLIQPTLSLYSRETNEKIWTWWFKASAPNLDIALRAARLLERHGFQENDLIKKITELGFKVAQKISDGYLSVYLAWDVSDDMLKSLIHFLTNK